jgi:hypothetical protein
MRAMQTLFTLLLITVSVQASANDNSIPRIGVLVFRTNSPYETGLRDQLRKLGYVEGKSILIDWRPSEGSVEAQRSVVLNLSRPNQTSSYSTALQPLVPRLRPLAEFPYCSSLATHCHPVWRKTS